MAGVTPDLCVAWLSRRTTAGYPNRRTGAREAAGTLNANCPKNTTVYSALLLKAHQTPLGQALPR